jgi:hypothetical protein
MFDEGDSLDDIRIEEGSRGRKRPIKAITRAREREIRRIAALLADPNCREETYLEAIHAFGLKDGPEYQKLRALWRKKHGGS